MSGLPEGVVLQETLLVSCVNDGGVFLLGREGVEQLSPIDTSGLAWTGSSLLLARQSAGSHVLRRMQDGDWRAVAVAEPPLDLHDVVVRDGRIHAVSTECNAVLELDADLREVRRWALPGERDAAHVNSLCVHEGRLLASRFGDFTRHRAYKGATAGAGQVFDVESGEVLISGLSQPHSLVSHAGLLWVCDSEAGTLRAYRAFAQVRAHAIGGYVRGLAFGGHAVYVGVSRRRGAELTDSAQLLVLDPVTLAEQGRVALPRAEIYDIRVFDGDPALLRKAALMEAAAAAQELEARSLELHAELGERDARLSALNARLDPLQREYAQATGHLVEVLRREAGVVADLADSRALAAETAAWADMLEREVEVLREAARAQAQALASWHAVAGAMHASRSWRLTRGLRALSRWLGRPAEAPLPAPPDERLLSRLEAVRADRAALPVIGLAFPERDAPLVSIVVAAGGRFDATLACLRAIARGLGTVEAEVMVAATAADPELARLGSVPGLRVVGGTEGATYVDGVNASLAIARGRYVHILDGATVVEPGWLDALLDVFRAFPDCGLVGSMVLQSDGRVDSVGSIIWSDGSATAVAAGGDDATAGPPTHVREVDHAGTASMLLPTDVLRHLQGMDRAYAGDAAACADLAFRVRGLGMRVCVQPASRVAWRGGRPAGATDAPWPAEERGRFIDRWSTDLAAGQLPRGLHPFLARERSQLRRIVLVVDQRVPQSDRDAGSRAIWQLMRVLHLQGFVVKFWAHDAGTEPVYAQLLRAHGIELLGGGTTPFGPWIEAHGEYLDHVVLSRPMVAVEYIDEVRAHSAASVVFYGHDVHHLRYISQAQVDPDPDLPGFAHHARVVEEALWSKSDLILYPAEGETAHVSQWLQANGATARAATVPLFAYEGLSREVGAGLVDRRNVLFVGGFAHAPNEDAAVWFATRVWPLVRARHPDYRLCLVGADPGDAVAALARADVLVTGYIPEEELVAYYASARVAVAPLRFGAGMKGKVLEAMRYGVPCVATSFGAQGFTDAPLRVADDREAFARHVIDLIRHDDAWLDTASRGIAYLEERFSVQSVWQVLEPTMGGPAPSSVAERLAGAGRSPASRQVAG